MVQSLQYFQIHVSSGGPRILFFGGIQFKKEPEFFVNRDFKFKSQLYSYTSDGPSGGPRPTPLKSATACIRSYNIDSYFKHLAKNHGSQRQFLRECNYFFTKNNYYFFSCRNITLIIFVDTQMRL